MEAREVVDAEIGEEDREKSEDGKPGDPVPPPFQCDPDMEERGVNEPCGHGPLLFRIPRPVGPPGRVGPDGAGDDADG